jgi:hypothetical protein
MSLKGFVPRVFLESDQRQIGQWPLWGTDDIVTGKILLWFFMIRLFFTVIYDTMQWEFLGDFSSFPSHIVHEKSLKTKLYVYEHETNQQHSFSVININKSSTVGTI